MNTKTHRHGFTLLEIVIVVAITAIISRIVFASFGAINNRQMLDSDVALIKSTIQKARLESLNSKGGIAHGVTFGSTSVTIVDQGTSTTRVISHASGVTLSTSTFGTSTVIFERVTGIPSATGTLTYSMMKGSTVIGTTSFSINSVGVIQ